MKKLSHLLILFFSCSLCYAQNLILNSGFETATNGLPGGNSLSLYPTFVDNWTAVNTDGEFIFDLALAHSGTGFLSVLQNAGANPLSSWLGAAHFMNGCDKAMQMVTVTPSTSYQLQFWVRSGNSLRYAGYAAGNLLVQVEQVMASAVAIDSLSIFTPFSWQQGTLNFTTGVNCTAVAILFSAYAATDVDAWVDDIDLHVTSPSGNNPAIPGTGIYIYPNPVSDKLNITGNTNELLEIILYDMASRKLLQKKFTKSTLLNTEHLSKGIYFYEVKNSNAVIKKDRLVKY